MRAMDMVRFQVFLTILILFATVAEPARSEEHAGQEAGFQLATFVYDVTPPMGHPLCGGWIQPVTGFDDPELAKGVILRDSGGSYVLCALDWCQLRNEAYDLFRRKIAEALDIAVSHVAVQCVHQHNAPISDIGAQRLLDPIEGAPLHADLKFLNTAAEGLAASIRSAAERMREVTRVGVGRTKVEKVASSRRVKQPDGTIKVRWSSTKDAEMHAAPEGRIDPWLRTIAFYEGSKPLAYLHYYATHPQSYYGDGRTTWDFPGMARERMEKEIGVFQVYFTGCAGDITAGKYNDGSPQARRDLAERMHEALARSIASIQKQPATALRWETTPVEFPLRTEKEFSEEHNRAVLVDPDGSTSNRLQAALTLAWIQRVRAGRPIELSCLSLGTIRILHLPGEPFVDFQLRASELAPGRFVAVAGYGDSGPGYICLEKAYAEGGYEPTDSMIAPAGEKILMKAIEKLLSP